MSREFTSAHNPVQITIRMCEDIPDLRAPVAWASIVRMLRELRDDGRLRVVHYAVLANHLHLVCEADGLEAFCSGTRSMCTRLALAINRSLCRHGRVLDHRFHARILASPRAVAASLGYVLLNARKHAAEHGRRMPPDWLDPRSSARVFDGWAHQPVLSPADFGVAGAKTWLLRTGWRRHGLLRADTIPGGDSVATRVGSIAA